MEENMSTGISLQTIIDLVQSMTEMFRFSFFGVGVSFRDSHPSSLASYPYPKIVPDSFTLLSGF